MAARELTAGVSIRTELGVGRMHKRAERGMVRAKTAGFSRGQNR